MGSLSPSTAVDSIARMLPPGPRTPALWQTMRFVTNPGPYGLAIRKKYGDIATFRAPFGTGVAIFESGLALEVFSAPPDTFATFPLVEALFGRTSVIAVSGAPHRKLRKLLNPRFHGAQVKGFLAAMQRAIRVHVDGLARAAGTGEVVVMGDMTQSLSLDVIIETVFGAGELDRAVAREVLIDSVHAIVPAIVGGTTFHKPWFP